jgi:hypothetical protein
MQARSVVSAAHLVEQDMRERGIDMAHMSQCHGMAGSLSCQAQMDKRRCQCSLKIDHELVLMMMVYHFGGFGED